ncbi:MAG TPA: IS3 family transposase [Ktedonobacteraceae bacterium]
MSRGYHAWNKREVSKRAQEDQVLAEQIERIFQANRGVYGSPRIHAERPRARQATWTQTYSSPDARAGDQRASAFDVA